jgi:hypothetical protein
LPTRKEEKWETKHTIHRKIKERNNDTTAARTNIHVIFMYTAFNK